MIRASLPTTAARSQGRRGFSLIEILIAVLVLALGLLGLGAVFPAVIAQQREAVDRVQGISAVNSATDTLRNAGEMANWDVLKQDQTFSSLTRRLNPGTEPSAYAGGEWVRSSLWEVEWPVSALPPATSGAYVPPVSSNAHLNEYLDTGEIRFGSTDENDPDVPMQRIPVSARIFPDPFTGEDPRYVWDFVCRRQVGSGRVEAALFVRRVDGRIRAAQGMSLAQTVIDENLAFPVAVNEDGFVVVGDAPESSRSYSTPRDLEVEVPEDPERTGEDPTVYLLDRIRITENNPEDADVFSVSQVGQLLVDNFGRVRRVVGTEPDPDGAQGDPPLLLIDPPFTFDEADQTPPPPMLQTRPETRGDYKLSQIVFTPEIPVSVEIVEVER